MENRYYQPEFETMALEEMQKLLGIPKNMIPCSMITLGYGKFKKKPQDRFDESCLHLDGKW